MDDETFDPVKFNEAFVKANANLDFIASEFADVLRDLMRAFVAQDRAMPIYRAAEHMNFVVELLSRTEENFGYRTLFSRALHFLDQETHPDDRKIVNAAKAGVKFLVERSCEDNAARGRASRREQEFMQYIQRLGRDI